MNRRRFLKSAGTRKGSAVLAKAWVAYAMSSCGQVRDPANSTTNIVSIWTYHVSLVRLELSG